MITHAPTHCPALSALPLPRENENARSHRDRVWRSVERSLTIAVNLQHPFTRVASRPGERTMPALLAHQRRFCWRTAVVLARTHRPALSAPLPLPENVRMRAATCSPTVTSKQGKLLSLSLGDCRLTGSTVCGARRTRRAPRSSTSNTPTPGPPNPRTKTGSSRCGASAAAMRWALIVGLQCALPAGSAAGRRCRCWVWTG